MLTVFPAHPKAQVLVVDPEARDRLGEKWFYLLLESYSIDFWDLDLGDLRLTVPEGFLCDGASVPRWAWTVSGLTPGGPILAGAIPHDFLYRFEGKLPAKCLHRKRGEEWEEIERPFTRLESDGLFRETILRTRVYAPWQVSAAYNAVRIGARRW